MEQRNHQLHGRLFGREVVFPYSQEAIGYALVILRITMGWILLQGGIEKVLDPTWSAAGYLNNAIPEGNPFGGLWQAMAGLPAIDFLNQWGLTLTGLGLILGALVRWNAFWGAVMMLFYWLSSLEGGLLDGLPVAHGWVVDSHIVYMALLFALGALGTGRLFGIDGYLEQLPFVKRQSWLRLLLG